MKQKWNKYENGSGELGRQEHNLYLHPLSSQSVQISKSICYQFIETKLYLFLHLSNDYKLSQLEIIRFH